MPALPLCHAFLVVTDFLWVEVGAFVSHILEVDAHFLDQFLGDHGGHEAVQRLLGAAVGVFHEVGDGIDDAAGDRW